MELINSIFEAAQDSSKFERCLDLYNQELGLKSSVIFSIHDFSDLRAGFRWSSFIREHLPPEIRHQLERGDDENERQAYRALTGLPAQIPYPEPELFGVEDHSQLPYSEIREAGEALGVYQRISCALNRSGPWMDALFVHGDKHFEGHDYCSDPKVQMLMPVLANAVELSRVTSSLRKKYAAALSALDRLGLGIFLLDRRGYVAEANRCAKDILDKQDGLYLHANGRLWCSDSDESEVLQVEHRLVFEVRPRSNAKIVQAITRPSGEFPYLWSMSCIKDADAEIVPGEQFTFLAIIDPSLKGRLSAEGIRILGGLTEVEGEITELLVAGHRVSEIAVLRDVQENTIRAHMKAIFGKLRCSSQADLMRLASATRLPLD